MPGALIAPSQRELRDGAFVLHGRYMTTPRLTKRRTSLEKHQAEVIAFLLTGWTPAQIATKYDVSRNAVMKFQQRHADELQALYTEVAKQTIDYAIADNVRRVAGLDEDWRALGAVQDARAADKTFEHVPGYSTGRMKHTVKSVGSGPFAKIVDEFEVDTAVIAERRNLVESAARLLGQMPKGGGDTYNIEKAVLVRYVEQA